MIVFDFFLVSITSICVVNSVSQQGPEINTQYEANHTEIKTSETKDYHAETNSVIDEHIFIPDDTAHENQTEILDKLDHTEVNDTALQITTKLETTNFMTKLYIAIRRPFIEFIEEPRVSIILKNIGTCVVNGAMEIISYYFPAPLIPLIASAAGRFIPFEPVVMLRKRMPVTSYRRAFNKAVNSFMGTFDRFKTSEEDPYMTRRFNRRYMQDTSLQDKN